MIRFPRRIAIGTAAVALGLLAAQGATGRTQTKPSNGQEPFISGPYLLQVGTSLMGHKGEWSGTEPISYQYQWMRCAPDASNCKAISNADVTSYKVKDADVGHTLRFQVTAKNADGKAKALSNATQEIPGSPTEPQASAAPTITGTAMAGEKLTAHNGTWKGTQPITYSYRWNDCTSDLVSCVPNGGTGSTYTLANADVGKRVLVQVLAKNTAGQNTAHSLPTDEVKAAGGGGGGGGGGNTIPVSEVGPPGDRLVVDQVTFSPNPVSTRSEPITVRIRVKNTKGKLVQGALVSIQSTPVVASIPTPAPTGGDGYVTYRIQPEGDFPLKNGYSVQFFVKAYKQGDPTLAGISGSRLVQVKTTAPK